MKRFLVILILLLLTATVSAINWEKQQKVRQELESRLFHDFCEGVRDNEKCRVPSPWNEKFWGVCCGGECNSYTGDCEKPGFGGHSLLDVVVSMPCMDRKPEEECDIPREIKKRYPDLSGVCCNSQCVYFEEECYGGYEPYDDKKRDEGPPSPEELKEIIDYYILLSCIAVKDGDPCQKIELKDPNDPDAIDLAEVLNLYGVCCSEKCLLRSTECPEANETKPDLVIIGMDIYPENITANDPIENLTITIKNQGNAKTTDPFWIEILKGDGSAPVNQKVEEDLNIGEAVTISIERVSPYQKPKRYTLTVIVDSSPNSVRNNLIDELDETNNKETWIIFVGESKEEKPGEDRSLEDRKRGDFSVLLLPIVIIILVLIAILYSRRSKKPVLDYELQIKRLLSEKKTIEEMIELAKIKYHKRKLDEESFREIVRDNQKRLIEIETKIKDIEVRTKRLEKR